MDTEHVSSNENDAPQPVQGFERALTFSGNAKEFFGIWIVNVLLTIVTLGIYSAWAKVRTNQYFYGNTAIENDRFTYLATPIQILKGRIIAVLFFITFALVVNFFPVVGAFMNLVFLLLMPLLICMSLRFNMRMTSFRNVRFDFTGRYGRAFAVFILYPFLSVFTLYLAFPLVLKKMDEFIVDNTKFGNQQFVSELETPTYYVAAIATICVGFVGGLIISAFNFGSLVVMDNPEAVNDGLQFQLIIFGLLMAGFFQIIQTVYRTMIRNHIYNNTFIPEKVDLESDVKISDAMGLVATNLLALVFTFGLAYAWVKVRTAHFYIERTKIFTSSDIDTIIDDIAQSDSALAEEVSDLFDVDIALT